jgi:HK97 family phage major capsid protein
VDANKFEREGSVSLDTIIRDHMKAIYKIEKNNIMPQNPGWVMHPRTVRYMMTLRGQDSYLLASQLSGNSLFGAPVYMTNALPSTLDDSGDGDNDETRIFYGDFSQCLIGDTLNLRVLTSEQATVKLGGNFTSMLQRDMRAIVLFHEVGFMLRRPESFSIIEGVDYGASFDA